MHYRLNGLLFANADKLDLTRSEYWTLHAIINSMNQKTGACFPSRREIVRASRLNLRCVIASIQSLERKGFIKTEQKTGRARYFTIIEEKLDPVQENTPVHNSTPVQKDTRVQENTPVQKSTREGCRNMHGRGAETCTRTENITENSNREIVKANTAKADVIPATNASENLAQEKNLEESPLLFTSVEAKPKRNKAERFNFDYTALPPEWLDICKRLRPDLDPEHTFSSFRYYCTIGKGATKYRTERGWNQAWLNWVKLEREPANGYANGSIATNPIKYPIEKIVDIYHDELPSLSQVGIIDDSMRANGGQFWKIIGDYCKCNSEQENLAGIRRFFHFCGESDFLMGRVQRINGNPVWRANFAWLINPKNTINIINGNYESK